MYHNPIREQDEYYCTKCGKRWDIHETPPQCIKPTDKRQASIKQVQKLRKEWFNHGN